MTEARTRSETLRANERIKHAAGVATAWGNALFIASLGTWAVRGFGADLLLWIVGSWMLIWSASESLTLIEAEPKDE